ncbi:tetratricopeptide repeat protein [Novipirellula aureliae]|nr:tetratricopeptide repeat protein [Novipirellula aureliae]
MNKSKADRSVKRNLVRWLIAMLCFLLLLPDAVETRSACADILTDMPADGGLAVDQAFLKEAQIYVRENEIEKARESLKRYAEKKPDSPHPEIILSQLLAGAGRGAEAGEVIESLAAENPDRMDVRLFFARNAIAQSRWYDGWTHLQMAAAAKKSERWSEEYKSQLDDDRMRLLAAYHEDRGQLEKADAIYESLARKPDVSADALTAFGRVRFRLDDKVMARKAFDRAFELDPTREVPALSMALLYDLEKKSNEAERQFRSAINHPNQKGAERAKIGFARWLLWNNRPADILDVLAGPFESAEANGERLVLQAMAKRMNGDFSGAIEILSPIHQQNPTQLTVGNEMALAMIESKDERLRSRALQIAQLMVRNNPNRTDCWATLGWVQFRLGDITSAKDSFSRAVSGGGISRDTAWHLSQLQSQLGNQEQAEQLLESAKVSKGPFFSEALIKD